MTVSSAPPSGSGGHGVRALCQSECCHVRHGKLLRLCSKIVVDRALPEWRHIPCAVRSYATEQDNRPEYELRAHPPLPVIEPQPLWEKVCAGHDDDIESQKLRGYPQNCVYCRRLVIPLMENLGQRRLHLLLEGWPHHQSDHHEIQEQHRGLADAVGSVAFLFRQTSPRDQRYSHDE